MQEHSRKQNTDSNPSTFAALLVKYVRERFNGDAPFVYNAAWVNRRTWSKIVCFPHRPVAKRTAIQFALALRLSPAEADELLRSAGFAFSPAFPDDCIFAACLSDRVFDIFAVNQRLFSAGAKPIPPR